MASWSPPRHGALISRPPSVPSILPTPSHPVVVRRRLQNLESSIIAAGFGLVIVDSIASLIRKEFGSKSSDKRADLLATEAALLKYIAEAFSIPVIVTNQVTTKLDDDFGANGKSKPAFSQRASPP